MREFGEGAGPIETGAYAINDLLKPASVIFTHVHEAATEGGKLKPGTQTAALMKQVETPAYLAISERTMEFDGQGQVCLRLLKFRMCRPGDQGPLADRHPQKPSQLVLQRFSLL